MMKNLNRIIRVIAFVALGIFLIEGKIHAQYVMDPESGKFETEKMKSSGRLSLKGANNVLSSLASSYCSNDGDVTVRIDNDDLNPSRTGVTWEIFTGQDISGDKVTYSGVDWFEISGEEVIFKPNLVPSDLFQDPINFAFTQDGTADAGEDYTIVYKTPAQYNFVQTASICDGLGYVSITLSDSDLDVYYNVYRDGTKITSSPIPGTGDAMDFFVNVTGTYTVKASGSSDDSSCSAWMTGDAVVTIHPRPVPTVAGDNDVCAGETGVTYSTEESMTGYTWNVTGGTITAGAGTNQITVTWNTAGAQEVSVNYTNENGCNANSPTVYGVTVNALPNPSISGDNDVCLGDVGVTYTTQEGMTNYAWSVSAGGTISGGDGTNEITVTWNVAGAQSVSVNYDDTNACGAATPTVYGVTVNDLPSPTITGANQVCESDAGITYTTEASMSNYVWAVSAGGTISSGAGTNEITVTWTTAGAQTVSVNYDNAFGCDADAATVYNVTVNTLPNPSVSGDNVVCEGETGVTYSTEDNMSNYVWAVTGGTITSGANTNEITVTWTTAGPQTVSANYNNTNGCDALNPTTYNVNVNAAPLPTISGDADVCEGDAGVTYSTQENMSNYVWTVSAGGTITAGDGTDEITVTWTTAGAQTVSVDYNDGNGCGALSPTVYNVTVNTLPNPTLSGAAEVCEGAAGITYATDAGMSNYVWAVSAGGTITGGAGTNEITVTWTTAGARTVSVNYDNVFGCDAVSPTVYNVTVNNLPVPTVTGDNLVCEGDVGVTYSTELSMNNYVWTIPSGGTITNGAGTNEITVTWTTAGNHVVYVNYDNAPGCRALAATAYNVTVNAAALPVVSGAANACEGDVETYSTQTGMSNYVWAVSAGGTITSGAGTNEIEVTWNGTGAQTVSVDFENAAGCNALAPTEFNVMVNTVDASLNITRPTPPGTSVCKGTEVTFSASGASGSGSYEFEFFVDGVSQGARSATSIFVYTFVTVAANVEVDVVVTDLSTGCTDNDPINMTVREVPTASLTVPADNEEFCEGQSVTLEASHSGYVNYVYYKTDGATNTALNTVGGDTFEVTDGFDSSITGVYVIASNNGCETQSSVVDIQVNPLPVADAGSDQTICEGDALTLDGSASGGTPGYTYSWALADGGTDANEDPDLGNAVLADEGTYTLTVTDSKTCVATDDMVVNLDELPVDQTVVAENAEYCEGDAGVRIYLQNSEAGVRYQLQDDSDNPVGADVVADGTSTVEWNNITAGTYHVVAFGSTANACSIRMTTPDITVDENALPTIFNISPSNVDEGCNGGAGWPIQLDGSQAGIEYQLLRNGSPYGAPVAGRADGAAITLNSNVTAFGVYTIRATNTVSLCSVMMNEDYEIRSDVVVTTYDMTSVPGTGDYCSADADPGVVIGMTGSDATVEYQLILNGNSAAPEQTKVSVAGGVLTFDNKVLIDGVYTVQVETPGGCSFPMNGSITVTAFDDPTVFDLQADNNGFYCPDPAGSPTGVEMRLVGQQNGIEYTLYRDNGGSPIALEMVTGTVDDGSAILNFTTGPFVTEDNYYVEARRPGVGCTSTMNNSIAVTENPLLNAYNVSVNEDFCEGSSTSLYIDGSENDAEYRLYVNDGSGEVAFGDWVAGTGAAMEFAGINVGGTYRVVAQRTENGITCARQMANTVDVIEKPLPEAKVWSTSGGTGCDDGVVITIENSQTGVTYYLYKRGTPDTEVSGAEIVGDGNDISFAPLSDTGAEYNVIAELNGCTNDYDVNIPVDVAGAITKLTLNGGGSVCSGGTVGSVIGMTEATAAGVSYELFLADNPGAVTGTSKGIVTGDGTVRNFGNQTDLGEYYVMATNVADGSCPTEMTNRVTISFYPQPTAGISVLPDNTICDGTNVTFTATGGPDYQFYLNGNPIGVMSPVDTYVTNALIDGSRISVMVESGDGCADMSDEITMTVNPMPVAKNIGTTGSFCQGGTSNVSVYVDDPEAGFAYTLIDESDNSVIGVDDILPILFADVPAGTYRVEASGAGCSITMSNTVTVAPTPLPTIFDMAPTGSVTSCTDNTIKLLNSETDVAYTLWRDGSIVAGPTGGTDNGVEITFGDFGVSGTYTVTAENITTGCGSNMNGSYEIIAGSGASFDVLPTDGNYCAGRPSISMGDSENGIKYILYRNEGGVNTAVSEITSSADGEVIDFGVPAEDGTYIVVGEDAGGCQFAMNNSVVLQQVDNVTQFALEASASEYCPGDAGIDAIHVKGQELGVVYTLFDDDDNQVGVSETGIVDNPNVDIVFAGPFAADTYYVMASNGSGCTAEMSNQVSIKESNAIRDDFEVIASGDICSGGSATITTNGSENNVTYWLYRNGLTTGNSIVGNGGVLDPPFTVNQGGTYTIEAVNAIGCRTFLIDDEVIAETNLPTVKATVSTGGTGCSDGVVVTVQLADPNITYQLYKRTAAGDVLVDGSAISHTQAVPMDMAFAPIVDKDSYYTVKAFNGSCEVDMSNNAGVDADDWDDVYIDIAVAPMKFEVGPTDASICNGDLGTVFFLQDSEAGVTYNLYVTTVAGTTTLLEDTVSLGGYLEFEKAHNIPGQYYVEADNSNCVTTMVNQPVLNVNPLPTAYKMIGSGYFCDDLEGAEIMLENQEANVRYYLQFEDGLEEGTVLGGAAGDTISFGKFTKEGAYSIVAYNELTTCTSNMEGIVEVARTDAPADQELVADNDTVYCGSEAGVEFRLKDNEADVTYQVRDEDDNVVTEVVGTNTTGSPVELVFPDLVPVGSYTIWKTRGGDACESITNNGDVVEITHFTEPTSNNVLVDDESVCGSTGAVISLEDFEPGRSYRIEDSMGPIAGSDTISAEPFEWNVTSPGGTSEIYWIYAIAGTDCDKSMGSVEVRFNESPAPFTAFTELDGNRASKDLEYCAGDVGVKIGIELTQENVAYMLLDTLDLSSTVDVIIGEGTEQLFFKDIPSGGYVIKALLYTTGCELMGTDTVRINEAPLPEITYDVYCNEFGNMDCTVGDSICIEPTEVDVAYTLYRNGVATTMTENGDGTKLCFDPVDDDATYTIMAQSLNAPYCDTYFEGDGFQFSYANFGKMVAVDDIFNVTKGVNIDTLNTRINDTIIYVFENTPLPIPYDDDEFDFEDPSYFFVDRYEEDVNGTTITSDNLTFTLLKYDSESGRYIAAEENKIENDTVGVTTMDSETGELEFKKTPGFFGKFNVKYQLKNDEYESRVDTASVFIYVGNEDAGGTKSFLIPNAFSPNGDDINDYFVISGEEGGITATKSTLEVFNRWGTMVYRSKGVLYGDGEEWWDGKSTTSSMVSIGEELPNGTYFYIFSVEVNIDGKIETRDYNGYIELRR